MNITETVSYDKDGNIRRFPWMKRLFVSIVVILLVLLAFGLGRLSGGGERDAIKIEYDQSFFEPAGQSASVVSAPFEISNRSDQLTEVVTSKNGTKYHYAHCPGAKQIKEENKIVYKSPEEAEAAGYTLAANCKAP